MPADRTPYDHIIQARLAIGRQKVLLHAREVEAHRELDSILGLLLQAERRLTEYCDKQDLIYTGVVQYVDHSRTMWIGKLDDGTRVRIIPKNLGPGEELIKEAGRILVKSYGGARKNPPFTRIS